MRFIRLALSAIVFATILPLSTEAQVAAEFELGGFAEDLTILQSDLTDEPEPTITIIDEPLHGTLTSVGSDYLYTPGDSFWALGSDTFIYRVFSNGFARATQVAHIIHNESLVEVSFDPFDTQGETESRIVAPGSSSVVIDQTHAIIGTGSLKLSAREGDPAYVSADLGRPGNGGDGGQVGCILGGPPVPDGGFTIIGSYTRLILADETFDVGLDLQPISVVQNQNGSVFMRIWDHSINGYRDTLALERLNQHAALKASYQFDALSNTLRGILWFDGQAIATPFVPAVLDVTTAYAGILPLPDGLPPEGDAWLDELAVSVVDSSAAPSTAPASFNDEFRDPDFAMWDVAWGDGLKRENSMMNTGGLRVDSIENDQSFLGHLTGGVDELVFRVDIDTEELTLDPGKGVLLAQLSGGDQMPWPWREVHVKYLYTYSGLHQVELVSTYDGNTVNSDRFTVTPGRHTYELYWRMSDGLVDLDNNGTLETDASNGFYRLWVDGNPAGGIGNAATYEKPVKSAFLGVIGYVLGTVTGDVKFDSLWITSR